jgi:DNA-binding transcriptional LysR family regulator
MPVFITLMEERSVTRAAARLGMTQPALSNALARLRTTLQDQLFLRTRYGIQPTSIALALAPVIADALARVDDAVLGQQDFNPALAKRLLTIAPNGYAEFVLAPAIIAKLGEAAPGIQLRLSPYGNDLIETGVTSGTTALVLGRILDPPDNLVVQPLMDDGFACVVRAHHPMVGDTLSRELFERLRHVNVLPPGRLRAGLFEALDRQDLRRDVVVSVSNFLAVPDVIAVTDYCATLPRRICQRLAKDPRLRVVPAPVDLGTFPIEMAWHVRYRQDPAHRWLRSLIGAIAGQVSPGHA